MLEFVSHVSPVKKFQFLGFKNNNCDVHSVKNNICPDNLFLTFTVTMVYQGLT